MYSDDISFSTGAMGSVSIMMTSASLPGLWKCKYMYSDDISFSAGAMGSVSIVMTSASLPGLWEV